MRIWRRLKYLVPWHRRAEEKDMQEELASLKELAAPGELGSLALAADNARDEWGWTWLDQFMRDTRIGARSLLKTPGFTIFATLILSIGIGAAVTVFAYFNSVFFKPLRIPNASGFVRIYTVEGFGNGRMSYSNFIQFRERNHALAQIGMAAPNAKQFPLRLNGPQTLPIDMVQPEVVSAGLFRAIGAGMLLGRGLEPGDEKAGVPNVVVLSDEAWRRYFARNTALLDKAVFLNNTPYTIVGVSPNSIHESLSVFPAAPAPVLFIPAREDAPPQSLVEVAGRLASGVSRSQAQADLSRIAAQLSAETKARIRVSVERADLPPSWLMSGLATIASFFLVVVFTVLLIACDDIAIMLFARITARQREMGIRVALGGSRFQLVRQLVSENILLAILGGAGAMIFILAAARLIERLPIAVPDAPRIVFNWRVLVFTTLTSLATTLFFGLRPALECVSRDVVASITPGSKVAGRRQGRVRSNLVIAQIAVCTALLITTAVVVRGIARRVFTTPGFKTDHLWMTDINFAGTSYNRDSQLTFYRQLLPRLMEAPGIVSASVVNRALTIDGTNDGIQTSSGHVLAVTKASIDGEYFPTLQAPLLSGRNFNDRDTMRSPPVGIINQQAARLLVTTGSLIGQTIRESDGTTVEIVGIAKDMIRGSPLPNPIPVLYRPQSQTQTTVFNTVTVMMKYSGPAAAANRTIHDKVSDLDPSLLVYNGMTLEDGMGRNTLPIRIIAYLIGIPGVFALLLGIVGTYGTMAILVTQQGREVGIRIALGAKPSTAVRGILKEGFRSVSIGVGLGLVAVTVILLWLRRNMGELSFFDPVAFASMILVVIATAGAACYIPAKRASLVDPMIVLRED
jgi:putative ABC transport system permease protein